MEMENLLKYTYPHDKINIYNDSVQTPVQTLSPSFTLLMPFISDKGEDGVFVDFTDASQTIQEYGTPNYDRHGQAYYQVINWLNGGGTVRGIRLTADDATYSNVVVSALITTREVQQKNSNGQLLYLTPNGATTVATSTTVSGGNSVQNKPLCKTLVSVGYVTEALNPTEDFKPAYKPTWNGGMAKQIGTGGKTQVAPKPTNSGAMDFGFPTVSNMEPVSNTGTPNVISPNNSNNTPASNPSSSTGSTSTSSNSNTGSSSSNTPKSSDSSSKATTPNDKSETPKAATPATPKETSAGANASKLSYKPASMFASFDASSNSTGSSNSSNSTNSENTGITSVNGLVTLNKNSLLTYMSDVTYVNQSIFANNQHITVQKIPLFVAAVKGKGEYGNSFQINITPTTSQTVYTMYTLTVINENGQQVANLNVSLYPNAVDTLNNSVYIDNVVANNDLPIVLYSNPDAWYTIAPIIANGCNQTLPPQDQFTKDDMYESLDILFGEREIIPNSLVEWNSINQAAVKYIASQIYSNSDSNALTVANLQNGITFNNGSDGAFTFKTPEIPSSGFTVSGNINSLGMNPSIYRADLQNIAYENGRWAYIYQAYYDFFNGSKKYANGEVINIKKNPANLMLDANFPLAVKMAMQSCRNQRNDCPAIFDLNITQSVAAATGVAQNYFLSESNYSGAVQGQWFMTKDPYSGKEIQVTVPYLLSMIYPGHANGVGMYIPFAGPNYPINGVIIPNTLQPVPLTPQQKQTWWDTRINYLSETPSGSGYELETQVTYTSEMSALTSLNNVFTIYAIKSAVANLVPTFRYQYTSSSSDMSRFNAEMNETLKPFTYQACQKLTATVSQSAAQKANKLLETDIDVVFPEFDESNLVNIIVEQ